MKIKLNQILGIFAMLCVAFLMSCEGPEGPAGADGAAGADGTNGVDGVDANAHCVECHSADSWDAIEAQFATSTHNLSNLMFNGQTVYEYAGSRGSCARCHSHQGFLNYVANPTGEFADISFPTGIDCETCHGNHGDLEQGLDVPIRTTASVTAIFDGTTVFDLGDNSNLCLNCHQSRRAYTYYEAVDSVNGVAVGAGEVGINSSHAGPHHSVQADMLQGIGGYGTDAVSGHIDLGCVSCHIGTADANNTAGGHTFKPSIDNCTECHTTATDFDINGAQTDFDARMAVIAAALVTAGALEEDGGEYHPHVGIVTEDAFKAFWHYMLLYEDQSRGVHNPGYTESLLTDAEGWLGITK